MINYNEISNKCKIDFWYYPKYYFIRIFVFMSWYFGISSEFNFFGRY